MFRNLKDQLDRFLARRGRKIVRYPLGQYLREFGIDVVLDVGANVGQYGRELRELGYRGRIVSFEPQRGAFEELQRRGKHDTAWEFLPLGLGDRESELELNISANGPSSSVLELDPRAMADSSVRLEYIGRETIQVRTLDQLWPTIRHTSRRPFLKVDTQGFERQVLEGAAATLPEITAIQLELSLVATYQGEALIEEMLHWLREKGFDPFWISPGYRNPRTQQLYQVDVVFARTPPVGGIDSLNRGAAGGPQGAR